MVPLSLWSPAPLRCFLPARLPLWRKAYELTSLSLTQGRRAGAEGSLPFLPVQLPVCREAQVQCDSLSLIRQRFPYCPDPVCLTAGQYTESRKLPLLIDCPNLYIPATLRLAKLDEEYEVIDILYSYTKRFTV